MKKNIVKYKGIIEASNFTNLSDKQCIEKLKMPEILLMENAGNVAFNRILKLSEEKKSFIVVCGTGNNGGDGFVIARKLNYVKKNVTVVVLGDMNKCSNTAKCNLEIVKNLEIPIFNICSNEDYFENEKREKFIDYLNNADIVIDCIFGTGLNRQIEGFRKNIIDDINENKKIIYSIDIPSGLNANTGKPMGISIVADVTVTFEYFKKGFINYCAEGYTGDVYVEFFGVDNLIYDELKLHLNGFFAEFTCRENIINLLKVKNKNSHKGDFGKVALFVGAPGFTGAGYLCSKAAVKTGSGLVSVICKDEKMQEILSVKLDEAMTKLFSDIENINYWDALAFGSGRGSNEETLNELIYLLKEYKKTMVIDADGINILAENLDLLTKYGNRKIILTPHVGEFSKLTGLSIETILENRVEIAKKFARKYNLTLVLKGKNTVITNGDNTYINTTGNQSMANGGMGDCLTGIIVSLLGQKYSILESAMLGVYIHGLIGDECFKENQVVNASDIINNISKMLKVLYNENR